MTVTDIEALSKTKVKVLTDDGGAFALYKGELGKLQIEKGGEISDALFHYIMDEVLQKRAKLRCMNLLKSRDYTEHRLRTKLKQGFYPDKIIEEALAYVKGYGYVDDVRYAGAYMNQASAVKSRKQIENYLMEKGVSKEDIRQAWEQCARQEMLPDESAAIERLLKKRRYDSRYATYEERQKMIGFLYRRGFSMDKICKAMEFE